MTSIVRGNFSRYISKTIGTLRKFLGAPTWRQFAFHERTYINQAASVNVKNLRLYKPVCIIKYHK